MQVNLDSLHTPGRKDREKKSVSRQPGNGRKKNRKKRSFRRGNSGYAASEMSVGHTSSIAAACRAIENSRKPQAYRKRGQGETIRFAIGQCSLGGILVASSAKGVCAVFLGDDPQALAEDLQRRFANAELVGGDAEFEKLVATVVGIVETPGLPVNLPLDIRGTAFQQRVWDALRKIPCGKTATYAEIAAAIGSPKAIRAVGTACGANPVSVLIPCHRVVKTDGSLSGYHWGVERKRELLKRESQ